MCHLSIKFLPEINNGSVLKKITMINEAHIFEENIIWLLLVWHYLLPLSLTPLHPQPMLIETISFMIQFLTYKFFLVNF